MNQTLEQFTDELGKLTPIELISVVKQLEKKWGISSSPIVTQQPSNELIETVEEQVNFAITLVSFGENKMAVIKEVRALIPGLGLLEAKKMVESVPVVIVSDATKEKTDEIQKRLESIGAKIEIQ